MTSLALVGFGSIAEKHLEVFRELGTAVNAACNRSEAGRARAAAAGIPRTYEDPLVMVERETPDALLVTASVLSLAELAACLVPCGIPIFLEKPPGTSLAETESLAATARRGDVPVMVGLNRRFYSVYHRALAVLGGIQAVTGVTVEWSEDPGKMRQVGHPEALLPLLSFANSLHGIDLLTFFGGEMTAPSVWGRDLGADAGEYRWQMDMAGVTIRGVRAVFSSSWDVPGRWRLVVDSPGNRLVSAPLETAVLYSRGRSPVEIEPSAEDRRFKPGFYGQAAAFLRVVRGEVPVGWPGCSIEEAVMSMRLAQSLTDACRGSSVT
jgi:predicted dehydrogenase